MSIKIDKKIEFDGKHVVVRVIAEEINDTTSEVTATSPVFEVKMPANKINLKEAVKDAVLAKVRVWREQSLRKLQVSKKLEALKADLETELNK